MSVETKPSSLKCAYEYLHELRQRFSNCGLRTTSGPRVLPLWSFYIEL